MHPLVHSLEQGNEERTRATEEEGRQGEKIGEKERMLRDRGVGSRGYNPDRAFPGTRT